jgi:hypothetical protein
MPSQLLQVHIAGKEGTGEVGMLPPQVRTASDSPGMAGTTRRALPLGAASGCGRQGAACRLQGPKSTPPSAATARMAVADVIVGLPYSFSLLDG